MQEVLDWLGGKSEITNWVRLADDLTVMVMFAACLLYTFALRRLCKLLQEQAKLMGEFSDLVCRESLAKRALHHDPLLGMSSFGEQQK